MPRVTDQKVLAQLNAAPWESSPVIQPANPFMKYAQPASSSANPYAKYAQPSTQGPWTQYQPARTIAVIPPSPKFPLDLQHMRGSNDLQQQELARQGSLNSKAQSDAQEAAARARYAEQLAKAQRDKAVADAAVAQQNAAGAAGGSLAPSSDAHGDEYLKGLPKGLAATVKAVATGNVMLPANALKTPYWQQVLQHTLNYDPEFNAADFNTRARTRQDFANGKMGINITALNTALGHAGEVLGDVKALNNAGGIGTTLWNPIANAYLRHTGDPRVTNFENDTMAFGGELAKVFAGSQGGGQGEREEWRTSVPINGSPAQQVGVLTQDAKLLRSRIEAINEQYKRGMGRTADISDLLDPHARQVYTTLLAGNQPPASGGGPGAPSSPGSPGSPPNAPGAPTISLANGQYRVEPDAQGSKIIDAMIRSGASDDQIDAALTAIGSNKINRSQAASARAYLRKNPTYKGGFGAAERAVPTTAWQRVASSPTGTGIYAGIDSALGGTTDEIAGTINGLANGTPVGQAIADANAKKQLAYATNPTAAVAGNIVGGALGYWGGAKLLGGTAIAATMGRAAPYAGSAAFGALSGAGQDNDNRVAGSALGTVGGLVGQGLGELAAVPIGAGARALAGTRPGRAVRGMFGRGMDLPAPLSAGQMSALSTINRVGVGDVRSSLGEAQRLGVPMSLADTAPQLSSLAGAAVRRSPNAAAYAEGQLIPRNRGQIDRFGAAVNRDLGPVANIPQTAADLTTQARTAAAPLYDAAYANPGASSVDLTDLMQRPSMVGGLRRAHSIAKEDGRDPTSLGFDLDPQGEVTLTRVPSWQTLDYVKRGLDDTLEQYRDTLTGKLQLNEATRAINNTKNDLLGRIDKVNPDYAAARSAYAGPVQARDAFQRGVDSFSLSPDELAFQAAGQSPEHLAQMQVGQRSALMDRANSIRDVNNPFEATLGSPAARGRIDALYPDNPGTANLFRTRDLEQQLQRTTNDVLGNSKTAQRGIADQDFASSPIPAFALDAALAAHGGVPVASIARGAARGGVSDLLKLGIGRGAARKADELAPILLNPDPAAATSSIDDLLAQAARYEASMRAFRPVRPLGMFGARMATGFSTRP